MNAIIAKKYGSPDVLEYKEVSKPVPKQHELFIKVHAATVNRTDCAILRAKPFIMRLIYGFLKPKKSIPGTDFAGVVEAAGNDVKSFKIGDRVFGFDDNGLCSHAEYLTIAENNAIATIPDNITFEEATASIEGAHYAYNMVNKLGLNPGSKVIVNGASGAIGSAVVQLLKYFGMNVTAVCGTQNIDLIKSLGADAVIDYMKEDFTKSNEKYSCVFDTVGKSSFGKCKPILKKGGAYISTELGKNGQNLFLPLITSLFGTKRVIFPFPVKRHKSVQLIEKLMEEEKFEPVIDRTYKLEETMEAFQYVEKGEKTGNVVICISNEN